MSGIGSVGVVGGGAWGTALANAAAAAGNRVVILMRDPEAAVRAQTVRVNEARLPGVPLHAGITVTAAPEHLAGVGAALLAIPAQSSRGVLAEIGRHLPAAAPLIACAKGIERGTGLFPTDVIRAVRPDNPVAVLSGPSFAADVARGLPTAVVLASPDGALAERLAGALSGPSLRLYHGTDLRGVEIGGAAKNVLAIAVGIVEGRGLGESAKAALTARGFAELVRFAAAEGARPETLMGLSGLGDVVLSCGSAKSRNFAFGLQIGRGASVADAASGGLAEGAFTADALVGLARRSGTEMPVAAAVAAVLAGRSSVDEAVESLMSRPLRPE